MNPVLSTPVVFIVFNRPDLTREVFAAIREARPTKLLVIADGSRASRPGEAERCRQVRQIATAVDWPCELMTNFSQENMGCHPRIVSGLDWAFSHVEEAIILEDDCFPDASFFPFCEEMLTRYRDDLRIGAVGGTNFVQDHVSGPDSYVFMLLSSIWGWATWRSRWALYDKHMQHWPTIRDAGVLRDVFSQLSATAFWTKTFNDTFAAGEQGAWDYRWVYSTMLFNRLTIVPRVNLIRNLGSGPDATHTIKLDKRRRPELNSLQFPLRHPVYMVNASSLLNRYQDLFRSSFRQRSLSKLRRLLGRLGH